MKQQATPYLTFNGNAREALEFYKGVFEGEILDVQTFGEADYPTPQEIDNHIMHARFQKENLLLMFSDSFLDHNVTAGNNISLALELETEDEIKTYYDRLKENGTVHMELQDTFWGATFAKVQDSFGVIWDLNFQKSEG
ncbi:VOC family protein [Pontibacillus yanchengensis]|uniref:Glyoxalase n=1 Tax=Pontibacillus yanchengensis Y32 TaxID=1385514 RepID=A0A0A2T876_9BACI|nr:VOC family protein [Pontibacillus yanchengensis]KGP72002.1 glyoxalase [Pontibacillus yanchengensis Y32]